jgi:hypothetical protein
MIRTNERSWSVVQQLRSPARAVVAHRLRGRRGKVLVARCVDGRWASSALRLERHPDVVPLTLTMALRGDIDRLYEVDTSPRVVVFTVCLPMDEPGKTLKADVQACWQMTDPVRTAMHPPANAVEIVRPAVEQSLLTLVQQSEPTDLPEFEDLAAGSLNDMRTISGTGLQWGRVRLRVRPTDANIQAVRTARMVDREQRAIMKDRIEFYTDVIHRAPVGLLAMWLSEDPSAAREVLQYMNDNDVPVGRRALDAEDPVRSALDSLLVQSDAFQRQELLHVLFAGLDSRGHDDALGLLKDALAASLGTNGDGS